MKLFNILESKLKSKEVVKIPEFLLSENPQIQTLEVFTLSLFLLEKAAKLRFAWAAVGTLNH